MLTLIINFFPFYSTIVDGFLIVYQLGICCVYIVFVAQNIQVFLDDFTFFKGTSLSMYIIALFIPLCLLACIRNLKLLAPFSTLANVLTFIGLYTFQSIFLTKSIFQISFVCVCFNEIRFFFIENRHCFDIEIRIRRTWSGQTFNLRCSQSALRRVSTFLWYNIIRHRSGWCGRCTRK